MGDYPKAESLYQRGLKISEKVFGPEHPETARSLHSLALLYHNQAEFAKAESLYQRSLKIREKVLGPEHPDTATSLNNLAEIYRSMGDYVKAEPIYQRSLKIAEKILGLEHPDTAVKLHNLALLYLSMSEYAKAEPLCLRCLKIAETSFGPEHEHTAFPLDALGQLYYKKGNLAKAEILCQRSLKLREKALGPGHPDTATSLNNLAWLHTSNGDIAKAEPLFERSVRIQEKVLGPEHPDTVASLSSLAQLHASKGDPAKAEALPERTFKLREKILGAEHPDTAMSVEDLANHFHSKGDYSKAEPLYQRSLKTHEKLLGPEHPATATSLNGLAELYRSMGDYVKAEALCEQSLKIKETVLGPEHPDTATSLNNLARICDQQGNFSKAESLYQRSLKIAEKVLGAEHPDTATALNNLAGHHHHLAEYAKAEPLYQRSLKIREKVLEPEHPYTAASLNNLGLLYCSMGDYPKAEPLYQRSLQIYEKIMGPEHPDTAAALSNLSMLQFGLQRFEDALSLGRRYKAAAERTSGNILSFASERQRMSYHDQESLSLVSLLAILGSAADLAEFILRTKGMVLDSLLEDEMVAQASKDPVVKQISDELHLSGRRLTRLQMEAPQDTKPDAVGKRREELKLLEVQVEGCQKALARNVTSVGQVRRGLRVTVPDVQTALANDTVLLEFVRYRHYLGKENFEPRYGLVVVGNATVALKDAKGGEPVWVPLGSAEHIERNLQVYRAMMRGEKKSDPTLLHTLHTQLFAPTQNRLPKGITTLIFSPHAELNFFSFATLVDAQDRFLAEQYTVLYVASGRDLVLGRAGQAGSRSLAVFADPAFGKSPAIAGTREASAVQLAMEITDRRDYPGMNLGALPSTGLEAQFLREKCSAWHLEGQVYVGAQATELEVKAVKSPYILHLATHGFFLPDTLPTNRPVLLTQLRGEQRKPVAFHNPMHRSGLALAGAQTTLDAWKRGEVPPTENDGILMAQEVGTMDLKNTWLVVLSACDTGIGEARSGEGVLGLRRGFVQAGAQNLLMTLWSISDRWTVDIMKAFYEKAMATGGAPRAMAEGQAEWLARLRKEKGILLAARLVGPFVLSTRGRQPGR